MKIAFLFVFSSANKIVADHEVRIQRLEALGIINKIKNLFK